MICISLWGIYAAVACEVPASVWVIVGFQVVILSEVEGAYVSYNSYYCHFEQSEKSILAYS
jgi:hypothetical protein